MQLQKRKTDCVGRDLQIIKSSSFRQDHELHDIDFRSNISAGFLIESGIWIKGNSKESILHIVAPMAKGL